MCQNTLFLTLMSFRGADVLATCAPKATCLTDPRKNYTTKRVCVTAVSRRPMCRAVTLKSVLCGDEICLPCFSKLWYSAAKEHRWPQSSANLADIVPWTMLVLHTEARSWCHWKKWTLSAKRGVNRWIAEAVCIRGLHGQLHGVNRGAAAVCHSDGRHK